MAEILRITGKNTIRFDDIANLHYVMNEGRPPRGLSKVLTRREVLSALPRLPLGIRSLALKHGLSVIIFDFNIWDTTDTLMEDKEHDLLETLYEGQLYIESQQGWGAKAELQYKSFDVALPTSYKTVLYGIVDELDARDILGPKIRGHRLEGLRLTLYCEPYWHADAVTNLVNGTLLYNHDDATATHDNYETIAGASIEGDVPAKVYIRVDAIEHELMILRVFARHKGTPANFVAVYEAESCTNRSNWADLGGGMVDASNAQVVSNAPQTSGYVYWLVAANKPDQEGTFHLFARLYTDNKTNTRFRARLTNVDGTTDLAVGQWKALDENSVWKFIDLGQFTIETPYGLTRDDWRWYVDYTKDGGVTARLDWLFIAPVEEGIALLLPIAEVPLPTEDEFTWRGTHDFVEAYHWDPGGSRYMQPLNPQGWAPYPSLMPQQDTRVYFSVDTESGGGLYQNDVHEGGDERFHVYIDYLPQYISPLE